MKNFRRGGITLGFLGLAVLGMTLSACGPEGTPSARLNHYLDAPTLSASDEYSAWGAVRDYCKGEAEKSLLDRDCDVKSRDLVIEGKTYNFPDYRFYRDIFNIDNVQVRLLYDFIQCLDGERSFTVDRSGSAFDRFFFDTNRNGEQDEGEKMPVKICLSRMPTSTLTRERK